MKSARPPRDSQGTRDYELPDDPRLMKAVQEYLKQLEAGKTPNRKELLRRYKDLAEPLARCLDGLDLVHKAGRPGAAASRAATGQTTTGNSLGGIGLDGAVPANPLGDFQILREVGRGGMGIVYEAMQLSLGRRVALKVLPFAATFDAKHLQRFHNEAHAAAQLHHTNIVPVYAVGSERGVHFYAMQLIEGQSLAMVIQQLRMQSGRPDLDAEDETGSRSRKSAKSRNKSSDDIDGSEESSKMSAEGGKQSTEKPGATANGATQLSMALSTQRTKYGSQFFRRLARFMVQAAQALEHAHQSGIVHRDIKPGNLLVDDHGRLWVTDFGLAHFHDEAGLTQTGDILGTLRYMSPEQASGRRVLLDHRTDVYSLGATMFELATLEPIFPGRNRQELLYQITHDEPRSPRSLEKSIPVELETIILKAVAKNPADRYSTAQEFADDLERYLEDEPILAKRPSLVERTRKWGRRHPSFVAAAMILLVFGVVGFATSTALIAHEQWKTQNAYSQLIEEEQRTRSAYEQLEKEQVRTKEAFEAEAAQRAEAEYERERAENDFALAQHAIEFFVQFSSELSQNPAMEDVRRRLLETALDYYEDFLMQHGDEPSIQEELAASRERAEHILTELSRLRGPTLLKLIQDGKVQKDLGLATDQRKKIDVLVGKYFDHIKSFWEPAKYFGDLKNTKPKAPPKAVDTDSVEDAVLTILNAEQKKRFQQIALQVQQQGRLGFSDPGLIKALDLRAEQRQKIRKLQNDAHKRWAEHIFWDKKIANPTAFWEKVDTTILAVLEAEQKQGWQEMAGKRLLVDLRPSYPFDGRDVEPPMKMAAAGHKTGPILPPPLPSLMRPIVRDPRDPRRPTPPIKLPIGPHRKK